MPEVEAVALACEHCGGRVLRCDHRSAASLEDALDHHRRKECAENLVERAQREYAAALQALHASPEPCLLWPEEEPPLVFCARHRLRDLAQALVESGLAAASAPLDATSKDGLTALHLAAMTRDAQLVSVLLGAGCRADIESHDNFTARLPGGRAQI